MQDPVTTDFVGSQPRRTVDNSAFLDTHMCLDTPKCPDALFDGTSILGGIRISLSMIIACSLQTSIF